MSRSGVDVSIIVVNYNGGEVLRSCLASIFTECFKVDYELIVVDNDSSDGSCEYLEGLSASHLRLIRMKENAGFAKANNEGIKVSRGRYVLLLNPDTVVLDGAVGKLIGFMEDHPHVGAAGCTLLNADHTLQHSIGRFPTLINQVAKALFLHRLIPAASLNELVMDASRYEETIPVDWVFGAALIVRHEAIDSVGPLDEDFFLFSEEKDWCFRLKAAGWPVYHYSGARIIHYGRGVGTTPETFLLLLAGKEKYFRKHNGPAAARIYTFATMVNLAVRTLGWGLAWLTSPRIRESSGRRHNLYRQAFMKRYLSRKVGQS